MAGANPTQARALTRRAITAAKSKASPYLLSDPGSRGLFVRVLPTGRKVWLFIHESDGRKRWFTLGDVDGAVSAEDAERYGLPPGAALDPEAARIAASACRAMVRSGLDPGEVRREAVEAREAARVEARTVRDVAAVWMEQIIERTHRRPEYTRRILDLYLLPAVGGMRIERVKRAHVSEAVAARVTAGTPTTANRLLLVAKKLFRFALERGYIEVDPLAPLTRKAAGGKEKPRDRNLGFDELGQFVRVLWSPTFPAEPESKGLLKLIVLTGQRAGETAAAKWQDIDLEAREWRIPASNTKSQRPHLVHLSDEAIHVLREVKQYTGLKPFVFNSPRSPLDDPKPVNPHGLSKIMRELFAAPEAWSPKSRRAKPKAARKHRRIKRPADRPTLHGVFDPFTVHDLRRTMASRMADLGIAPHVIEKCLNHALEGVLAVYQRGEWMPERRAAFEAWGAKLSALLAEEPGRVVHLRRAS